MREIGKKSLSAVKTYNKIFCLDCCDPLPFQQRHLCKDANEGEMKLEIEGKNILKMTYRFLVEVLIDKG